MNGCEHVDVVNLGALNGRIEGRIGRVGGVEVDARPRDVGGIHVREVTVQCDGIVAPVFGKGPERHTLAGWNQRGGRRRRR